MSIINLEIDQGSDNSFEFEWLDPDTNLPIDLTDYSATLQVRSKVGIDTVLLELTSGSGITLDQDGKILITITPEDMEGIDWFNGVYDLLLTHTGLNVTSRVARGFVTVSQQITIL